MNFSEKVYELCRKIPKGKVTTYKELGKALGGKRQVYRAVGRALNTNPYSPNVPCHRVVCYDGKIGWFAKGVKKKIAMLEKEGVKVVDGKIVDFEKVLWKF